MSRPERFWDRRAHEYDRGEKKYLRTYHSTIENTKRHLSISDIVLDYACGTGIITNEIAGGLFISATPCLGERKSYLGILLCLLSKIGIVPYVEILKFSELEDVIAHGSFQIVETENLGHTPPNYFIAARKI